MKPPSDGCSVKGVDPATCELIHGGCVGRDTRDYYCVTFEDTVSRKFPLHVHVPSLKLATARDPPTPGDDQLP